MTAGANAQAAMEVFIVRCVRGAPSAMYDIGVGPKTEWRTLTARYPRMRLFGCEPHPETYQSLLDQGFPGHLWPVALKAQAGQTVLFDVPGNPKVASLLPHADASRQFSVRAWTLDAFDANAGKCERILLWMDVEGLELQVLQGGGKLMTSGRVRWINLEERRSESLPRRGWASPKAVRRHLGDLGYRRIGAYNQHSNHQDVIYVHPLESLP